MARQLQKGACHDPNHLGKLQLSDMGRVDMQRTCRFWCCSVEDWPSQHPVETQRNGQMLLILVSIISKIHSN